MATPDGPDPRRLDVIRECMEHYEVGDPGARWPNNLISRQTVVYRSGRIARAGDLIHHVIDPNELNLCRRLAKEADDLMTGVSVGMGSESDDEFHEFFIAGSIGELVPSDIDEALIRSRFSGTIFPLATITVEPLQDGTDWWSAVEEHYDADESEDQHFVPWRAMMSWFHLRPEFVTTAFIQIGNRTALSKLPSYQWPDGTVNTGSVMPRLAVGLTRGGSLVGLFGTVVHT